LSRTKAVIFGCEGLTLTEEEKSFFAKEQPYGFILFKRNVDSPAQVKALVQSLRGVVKHDCPVMIDQEGGRVARLRPPHWPEIKPMGDFGKIANDDIEAAKVATFDAGAALGEMLIDLGINVDCAPVADLACDRTHEVIGNRAFGDSVEVVSTLARALAEGLQSKKVLPIIKHIPGHGRALCDSHKELPVVDTPLEILQQTDFAVFRALRDLPWAMTAHIIYRALDASRPATTSKEVIRFIRDEIGFEGTLITDDLSMEALKGPFEQRTERSFEAGVDIVLHCNGKMEEMQPIAAYAAYI